MRDNERTLQGYGFLLTWRWLGILGMSILFATACVGLGNWQMDRRNQAVAEIRRVQQNYDKPPVPYEEASRYFDTPEPDAKWATVSVNGQYLPQDQRIVRNRPNYSAAGYEVLVPFRLVSGETIIINRGWLPIGNNRPGYPDTVPAPPPGTVTTIVRIKPSEANLDRAAPEGQLASIDLASYAQQLQYPIKTGSYGLMDSETPPSELAPQQLAPPKVQEGSNLSYAMQWITFGVLAFVGFGYMARQQARISREEREGHESSEREETAGQQRKQRRLTSEDEEDALLDSMGL